MAQSFVHGTMVLVAASLFNRVVGFLYQILLIRLIRPEGVGLFAMVYPFYILVVVVATMGLPTAVAKLVAEEAAQDNMAGAYRIFRTSMVYLVVFGSLFTIFPFLLPAHLLQRFLPNPGAYYSFLALAPATVVVAACSGFRGFFQGLQRMGPTAASQAVEQLTRFSAGLLLATLLLPRGVQFATAGVSLGVVAGEVVGFAVMLYIYCRSRPRLPVRLPRRVESLASVTRRLFALGIPVTMTRFVATALFSVEALLIPQRLVAAGIGVGKATALYGQLAGIAETLLYTPSIVTLSLATALLPAVSDALAHKNHHVIQFRTQEALRLTLLVGLPAVVFFLVLPRQLAGVIFGYPAAGDALLIMATGGIFLYLLQTSTGILQGLGRPLLPFKNLVIASVFKLAGIYYLTALPNLNIRGTAAALSLHYILMACLNLADLHKVTGISLDLKEVLGKPALCAGVMGLVVFWLKQVLFGHPILPALALVGTVAAGTLAYALCLLVTGTLRREDIHRLMTIFRPYS
ncbi:MAG TPA: stage V sporulation protein B [Spirochaetia bacterium]|nr:stage V sporulation protein B [Spirochaetia bacterium]